MKKLGRKSKSNLIFSLAMLVVCGALCLLPDAFTNPSSAIPREKVRIDSVDNTQLYPLGIVYSGSQNCEVTVLTGEYAGQTAVAHNYQNSALDKDKLFETGDTAHAMVQMGANGLTVTLIDHYRLGAEGWIFAALALALIAVGGAVGCGALVSLISSVVMIWKLLIPLLLRGVDPILASFVTVLILTVVIDLLVAGWTKKCLVAMTGSVLGTLLTCLLAYVFTDVLNLDGGDTPYIVPLLSQSAMTIDPKALYIGMVFIANAGALMDLSMDVSISCEEIVYHRPDIGRGALLKSGVSIGRGVLGTQTTTLMLAYSGNYLSMLMYFAGQGTPVMDVLNLKYVASQLMNTLVGSFGLVAAAPLTALAASVLYTRRAGAPAEQAAAPQREALPRA
ncbi:MAG TPA: YibE/F family protein [Candidatus Pullichristensenella avicola]|nr:YibE/F family protein [Candidatus Pullichristensenella avicola]